MDPSFRRDDGIGFSLWSCHPPGGFRDERVGLNDETHLSAGLVPVFGQTAYSFPPPSFQVTWMK